MDAIFIGPYDLSVSFGVPGDTDCHIMQQAIERIVAAGHNAGKKVLIFCPDTQRGRELLALGIDGIVYNTDVGVLIEAFQTSLEQLRGAGFNARGKPGKQGDFDETRRLRRLSEAGGILRRQSPAPVSGGSFHELAPADIALVGGKVVIPQAGVISANLYVKGGKIAALSDCVLPAKEQIDIGGKFVLPGIIDPHTHFGIGTDFQTDLRSESLSAVIGGVTTVGTFIAANHSNIADFPKLASDVAGVFQRGYGAAFS